VEAPVISVRRYLDHSPVEVEPQRLNPRRLLHAETLLPVGPSVPEHVVGRHPDETGRRRRRGGRGQGQREQNGSGYNGVNNSVHSWRVRVAGGGSGLSLAAIRAFPPPFYMP